MWRPGAGEVKPRVRTRRDARRKMLYGTAMSRTAVEVDSAEGGLEGTAQSSGGRMASTARVARENRSGELAGRLAPLWIARWVSGNVGNSTAVNASYALDLCAGWGGGAILRLQCRLVRLACSRGQGRGVAHRAVRGGAGARMRRPSGRRLTSLTLEHGILRSAFVADRAFMDARRGYSCLAPVAAEGSAR